ncbi:hypothetical protein H8E77_33110 [bacterium]|nr:hypothetical protein [bacterium]
MAKRKLIPILVVLILVFIASQFNAFGSLTKLTGKLIETVKATITKVSRILVVKEKDTKEIIEKQPMKQKTVSIIPKENTSSQISNNLTNSTKEEKLENNDWEDEIFFYPFSSNLNDDFGQEPEYDDIDVEESDDWDSLLESLTIEIFSLSDEDYSEYFDVNGEEEIESLLSLDELSTLEEWFNIDKKAPKESEDSILESPELMDEFDYMLDSR